MFYTNSLQHLKTIQRQSQGTGPITGFFRVSEGLLQAAMQTSVNGTPELGNEADSTGDDLPLGTATPRWRIAGVTE